MLLQLILFLFRLIACYCGLIFISACVIWSIFSVVLFLTIFFCPVFYFVLGWNLVIFDSSHNHCVLFCCCGCYLVLLGSFVPFMLILVSKLAGLLAIYFFYLFIHLYFDPKKKFECFSSSFIQSSSDERSSIIPKSSSCF
jgi:hypothetical protein